MYIPKHVRRILTSTITLTKENERDVPERDRMHDLHEYDDAQQWLDEHTVLPEHDSITPVELHCTNVQPGDLFRPITPDGVENTNDWKVFLGGEMTPNETWYYAMAYADPDTGVFEGVHHEPDTDPIQVVTMCRACGDHVAEHDADVKVEGALLHGPVCDKCYTNHSARPPSESA